MVPVDTADHPWLAGPCAYDGWNYQARLLGPWPAGIVYEPYQERTDVETYDAAGFTVARHPAPVYRCATCGQSTTRRVPVAFYLAPGQHPALQLTGEYRAECPSCARAALRGAAPPT